MKEHFTVDLEAVESGRFEVIPPSRRLARALEVLSRSYGLRCTGIERRAWGPDRDKMSQETRGQGSSGNGS